MTSAKFVFRKAKEIHYTLSTGNRDVSIERIASELQITAEEANTHLVSLKNLRLIRFKDDESGAIEMTKIGLSTKVGD